jgi:hypothetical protein
MKKHQTLAEAARDAAVGEVNAATLPSLIEDIDDGTIIHTHNTTPCTTSHTHTFKQLASIERIGDFWLANVERGLLDPDASSICRYTGLSLLELLVARLPARAYPRLFTRNALASLIELLGARPLRPLYAKAHRTLSVVVAAAARQSAQFALLGHLLGEYGDIEFDRVTHTHTVAQLVASLDARQLSEYQLRLCRVLQSPADVFDIIVSRLDVVCVCVWHQSRLFTTCRVGSVVEWRASTVIRES